MALKFHSSLEKGLKIKVRMFLEIIPMFVEVTGEKLVGERPFWRTTILNWVKGATKLYFTHSSCLVIIFFNTDLYKPAFSIYSLKKLCSMFFVHSVLNLMPSFYICYISFV